MTMKKKGKPNDPKREVRAKLPLDGVSFEAKAVAGAWFSLMSLGRGELTLQLGQLKPADKVQAALDEMVRARFLSVEPLNEYGGLVYRPLVDMHHTLKWLHHHRDDPRACIRMMVPIGSQMEAKAVQAAALAVRPS